MKLHPIAQAIRVQYGLVLPRSACGVIYARVGMLQSLKAARRGVDGERI